MPVYAGTCQGHVPVCVERVCESVSVLCPPARPRGSGDRGVEKENKKHSKGQHALVPRLRTARSTAGTCENLLRERACPGGVLATKVRYFGVKYAKVLPGADGHLTC